MVDCLCVPWRRRINRNEAHAQVVSYYSTAGSSSEGRLPPGVRRCALKSPSRVDPAASFKLVYAGIVSIKDGVGTAAAQIC